jgi:hypothetical protein
MVLGAAPTTQFQSTTQDHGMFLGKYLPAIISAEFTMTPWAMQLERVRETGRCSKHDLALCH